MKLIIAGSRTASAESTVAAITAALDIVRKWPLEVVSGGARGADTHGVSWAELHDVPVRRFPADWNAHGRAAGPTRNAEMAKYADSLVAVWDGQSRGTRDMINRALREGLWVYVWRTDREQ